MDNFLTAEEEFELQYQEELDLINEYEENYPTPNSTFAGSSKTRQCIDFNKSASELSLPKDDTIATKRSLVDMTPENKALPPAKRSKHFVTEDDDLGITFLDPPSTYKPKTISGSLSRNIHGVTSLRFPEWDFVTIRTEFNERLFVRVRKAYTLQNDNLSDFPLNFGRVSNAFLKMKENIVRKLACEDILAKACDDVSCIENGETCELWVEQFKPQRYLDLLSDEGVNRALLTWVKTWDKIVFNRERLSKKLEKTDNTKPFQFKGKFQIQEEKARDVDEDGRPCHKVALLCGSPGIGKTTLAHVIATLAGYNVIEVNASDDRSVDSFRTSLENATEMRSVLGNRKPNCLILDEIDGAPAPSIEFLVKFINGKVTEKLKKGTKEKTKKMLNRPVICICNEPYTPALRQLRQLAYVLYFPHTSSTKLALRLLDICRHQGMKTDLSTLTLLCDKAQSDIRSCITTLHFFKSQKRNFRASDVKNSSVGLKDLQKSLFNIWQEIFRKPVTKSMPGESVPVPDDSSYHPDNLKRLQNIVHLLSSSGDYEKLQQGVYENVLKMQFPWFQRSFSKGLEWFCFSDLLDTSIRQGQNFVLMTYQPYCFAMWHFLYSTPSWPKITYPSVSYENYTKEVKCKQILTDVMRGLKPSLRAFASSRSMLLDVLPLLPTILAPSLRAVNTTLFNAREKADFANLINILLDFNMNYVQQRAADGTYFYSLDPRFEEVVKFETSTSIKSAGLPYSLKQTISREVELERVRRNDVLTGVPIPVPSGASPAATVPSHQMKLKPKSVPAEPMQYKDFFGRIVQIQKPTTDAFGMDKNNFLKSSVWYSYKEGFNNAVKKDMTIADLL